MEAIARPRHDHIWLKKLPKAKLANMSPGSHGKAIWLADQTMDEQQLLAGEVIAVGPDVLEQPPIGTIVPGIRAIVKHLRGDPIQLRREDYQAYGLEPDELVLVVQEDDLEGVLR